MCLLIFAHNVSPQQPLVIAANRDEFHARPTTASDFWAEYPELLAGRDREQGGTWMGITRAGRFAAITCVYKYTQIWCRQRDSNSRPEVYKTPALPTELYRHVPNGWRMIVMSRGLGNQNP